MKRFWKRVVMILMCVVAVSFYKVSYVQAQSVTVATPRYISISKCNATLTLAGEADVYVKGEVIGVSGTSKTSIVAVLQRQRGGSWVDVKTWEKSSASKSVSLQENYPISSGTYRVLLTGTADSESTTVYSSTLNY